MRTGGIFFPSTVNFSCKEIKKKALFSRKDRREEFLSGKSKKFIDYNARNV
jgi:hypothetical protein